MQDMETSDIPMSRNTRSYRYPNNNVGRWKGNQKEESHAFPSYKKATKNQPS